MASNPPKPPAPAAKPPAKLGGFITTGENVRNFVGIAFIVSILLHAAFTPLFPNLNQHHEDQEVEKVSVTKKIIVHTPPPPTPTPAPTPTPPPNQTPQPQKQQTQVQPLKVNLVHTTNNNSTSESQTTVAQPTGGSENGAPAGAGNATGPPATSKPGCANPNRDATVTNAMQPDYPDSAKEANLGDVTVQVEVSVGPSGNLVSASIYKSSNNMAVDQAALRAARQSSYAPKLVDCQPTTGDYLFSATFTADQ